MENGVLNASLAESGATPVTNRSVEKKELTTKIGPQNPLERSNLLLNLSQLDVSGTSNAIPPDKPGPLAQQDTTGSLVHPFKRSASCPVNLRDAWHPELHVLVVADDAGSNLGAQNISILRDFDAESMSRDEDDPLRRVHADAVPTYKIGPVGTRATQPREEPANVGGFGKDVVADPRVKDEVAGEPPSKSLPDEPSYKHLLGLHQPSAPSSSAVPQKKEPVVPDHAGGKAPGAEAATLKELSKSIDEAIKQHKEAKAEKRSRDREMAQLERTIARHNAKASEGHKLQNPAEESHPIEQNKLDEKIALLERKIELASRAFVSAFLKLPDSEKKLVTTKLSILHGVNGTVPSLFTRLKRHLISQPAAARKEQAPPPRPEDSATPTDGGTTLVSLSNRVTGWVKQYKEVQAKLRAHGQHETQLDRTINRYNATAKPSFQLANNKKILQEKDKTDLEHDLAALAIQIKLDSQDFVDTFQNLPERDQKKVTARLQILPGVNGTIPSLFKRLQRAFVPQRAAASAPPVQDNAADGAQPPAGRMRSALMRFTGWFKGGSARVAQAPDRKKPVIL